MADTQLLTPFERELKELLRKYGETCASTPKALAAIAKVHPEFAGTGTGGGTVTADADPPEGPGGQ